MKINKRKKKKRLALIQKIEQESALVTKLNEESYYLRQLTTRHRLMETRCAHPAEVPPPTHFN